MNQDLEERKIIDGENREMFEKDEQKLGEGLIYFLKKGKKRIEEFMKMKLQKLEKNLKREKEKKLKINK